MPKTMKQFYMLVLVDGIQESGYVDAKDIGDAFRAAYTKWKSRYRRQEVTVIAAQEMKQGYLAERVEI